MPDHNSAPSVEPERSVEVERLRNEVQRLQTQCDSTCAENSRYQSLLHRIQRVHRNAELLFWDCDGDNLSWRASAEALAEWFGLPTDAVPLTERGLMQLIHSDDRERVQIVYDCSHEAETDFEVSYRLLLPDGSTRYIHEYGVANNEATGDYAHSGAMHNVTDRTIAEHERARLIQELESRNSELEQFTDTVSHDLKAPLITVRGFLGLLEKDLAEQDLSRIHDDMDKIRAATEGMKNVLEDLLHLSRIGRAVNPESETPFNELIDDVMYLIGGFLNEKGVQLNVSADLPSVFGDRMRLVELLQNLMENAAKFMGNQSKPTMEVGASCNGREVHCYVADNGVGVEERFHERIFGLFQTLGMEASGTGVGLALAKKIVDLHGGRLWVESEGEGCDSRFCFSLPNPQSSAVSSA